MKSPEAGGKSKSSVLHIIVLVKFRGSDVAGSMLCGTHFAKAKGTLAACPVVSRTTMDVGPRMIVTENVKLLETAAVTQTPELLTVTAKVSIVGGSVGKKMLFEPRATANPKLSTRTAYTLYLRPLTDCSVLSDGAQTAMPVVESASVD